MKRDPDYKISWKDYAQILLIAVGSGFAVWLAIHIVDGWHNIP